MGLRVIALGTRMPAWVNEAFGEYAKRLRGAMKLQLIELPLAKRSANAAAALTARAKTDEGKRLLAALQPGETVVALDEHGQQWSSRDLSQWLIGYARAVVPHF